MEKLEIKDYLRETNLIQARLIELGVVLFILVLILVTRAWYLQVYKHDKFDVLSKDNRVRLVPVPPVRGQIYDRKGRVLAENVPIFTLEIVPNQVDDMDWLLNELAKIVLISPNQIRKFKSLVSARPSFEAQVLRIGLDDSEVARFLVNQHRLAGAQVQARLQRHYPYAGELVHVLGYVGRINRKEKETIDSQAYQGTEYIGKLGIEAHYEELLLGEVGYEQVETNAHGRPVRMLDRVAPKSGSDIVLNIDAELQKAARSLLGEQRGSIVAIDPRSGGVLAFISNPVYDPNKFVNGIDHDSYNSLRDDPYRPLLNRALYGRYAPGSTIKGIVSLAGLENGWSAKKQVTCSGYYQLKGSSHRYRCWQRSGHGATNLFESILKSCDVYYYQLANSLGIDKLHDYLTRFGLGKRTGIDLDTEPSGLVPSKEWKEQVKRRVWYPGETLITGIGQGYLLATPLQLGVMTATLANRGNSVEPRLVKHIDGVKVGVDNDVHRDHHDDARESSSNGLTISDANYDHILNAMQAVVEHPRGTAYSISDGKTYTMAGKTGTAQVVAIAQGAKYDESKLNEFQKDHALFIAFAPVDNPEIAVAAIVENGGSGSSAAAPIVRGVIDEYFAQSLVETQSQLASQRPQE